MQKILEPPLRGLVNSAPSGSVVNNFLPKFFRFPLPLCLEVILLLDRNLKESSPSYLHLRFWPIKSWKQVKQGLVDSTPSGEVVSNSGPNISVHFFTSWFPSWYFTQHWKLFTTNPSGALLTKSHKSALWYFFPFWLVEISKFTRAAAKLCNAVGFSHVSVQRFKYRTYVPNWLTLRQHLFSTLN